VVRSLLADLVDRGLRFDDGLLVVIDGAKALAAAVREVFGAKALIQRCRLHKRRNLADHLPDNQKQWVDAKLVKAFAHPDPEQGMRNVKSLAAQLDKNYPSAAASLREGLEEMVAVARLGIDGRLAKTLTTSNPVESMISIAPTTNRNVTRWRDGQMVLRWTAAGMLNAERSFRRIKGYKQMPSSSTPSADTPTPTPNLSVPPHRVHHPNCTAYSRAAIAVGTALRDNSGPLSGVSANLATLHTKPRSHPKSRRLAQVTAAQGTLTAGLSETKRESARVSVTSVGALATVTTAVTQQTSWASLGRSSELRWAKASTDAMRERPLLDVLTAPARRGKRKTQHAGAARPKQGAYQKNPLRSFNRWPGKISLLATPAIGAIYAIRRPLTAFAIRARRTAFFAA
jgi:hypothetical protein